MVKINLRGWKLKLNALTSPYGYGTIGNRSLPIIQYLFITSSTFQY
jgi:hypothetical protein